LQLTPVLSVPSLLMRLIPPTATLSFGLLPKLHQSLKVWLIVWGEPVVYVTVTVPVWLPLTAVPNMLKLV
jgi:hypothetical protein